MFILAIDLGKYKSMCCFFDTATQQHEFLTFATTRRYLTSVLKNHPIDRQFRNALVRRTDTGTWLKPLPAAAV